MHIQVPVNRMPCLFCVMCNVSWRYMHCKYYYLGFRWVRNDVILNWHQVFSIGGATHIHNLNNCPRANAFLCKKKAACINIKIVQTAWMEMYMSACFGQVQPKKWTIRLIFSRILVVVCSGLRWFVVVCLHRLWFHCLCPKFWWWFVVVCGDVRWFWFFSGGLWWFAVICGGLSFSHTGQQRQRQSTLSLTLRQSHSDWDWDWVWEWDTAQTVTPCGMSMTGTVEWDGCAVAKCHCQCRLAIEILGGILASNHPCATSLRNFGNSVYTTLTCQCLLEEMLAQSVDRPAGAIYGSLVRAGIHVSCKACWHDLWHVAAVKLLLLGTCISYQADTSRIAHQSHTATCLAILIHKSEINLTSIDPDWSPIDRVCIIIARWQHILNICHSR